MSVATLSTHPTMTTLCPRPIHGLGRLCLLVSGLLMLLLPRANAQAADFNIEQASVVLSTNVYRVDARIDYDLDGKPREALENGVPLVLELELKILRRRPYLWDETVASVLLRHRISYRALTRQYQLENLNTGELSSFTSLSAALGHLRQVKGFPLIDQALLEPDQHYSLALKADLDVESLPTPLRAMAYVTADWYRGSRWYELPLR